jgi:hypothetical protein
MMMPLLSRIFTIYREDRQCIVLVATPDIVISVDT